jgi:DNA mismatch repair protein MutS
MPPSRLTPLMSQYREIKDRYGDGILFFQVGDFYETFYDDAREVSRILNIALTSRDKKNPIPLAGVPVHAADAYISRLLSAGKKVVVCDQIEKPGEGRNVVRRQVTDVITPGTSLSPAMLAENENNFILSVKSGDGRIGFAFMDLSTGEFSAGTDVPESVESMIAGLPVREAIAPEGSTSASEFIRGLFPGCPIDTPPGFEFSETEARRALTGHFGVPDLTCFGLEQEPLGLSASGALLTHVKQLRRSGLEHVTSIRRIVSMDTLFLDQETLRNLELFEPLRGNTDETTLIHHIDRTRTAAGGRELRDWLMRPSRDLHVIEERLDSIEAFTDSKSSLMRLRGALTGMPDIERILSRIVTGKAFPRELLSLASALERMPGIAALCGTISADAVKMAVEEMTTHIEASGLIERSIEPDCPAHMRDGGFIRRGFDPDLDCLIDDSEGGKSWIASLQETERERTGIPTLKVGYNKVFGYYIEVSRIHQDKVPDDYTAKQTLVNSQRYITGALKERENMILTAESRRIEMERAIFSRICADIAAESASLKNIASAVARVDTLSSLADLALEKDYCRPVMDGSVDLVITGGRHPVVESLSGTNFIPNDLILRPEERQLLIITGPNMGGKSTYIRQAALISIMAHMGGFVPAARAEIGVMDRIFTRVGSSDNLARGQSTFLVEMAETARILHGCTSRSLVLLDEIGRGTSTLDGLSIAWAVTEFLVEEEGRRPKTLFATHYHELTDLADRFVRIHNVRIAVKEWGDTIVFLYHVEEGKSDKSYGIHVARLAGLPSSVVSRASEILQMLEKDTSGPDTSSISLERQMSLFDTGDEVRDRLNSLVTDNMTPIQALEFLAGLKDILSKGLDKG